MNFKIAVKAFIVHEGRLLVIKRRANDAHKPGAWDIPGGRLEEDESPFDGLTRETREEAGLEIRIIQPLRVHHFTRDDGQRITMLVFWCTAESPDVTLSHEHTEFLWVDISSAKEYLGKEYWGDVDAYVEYFHR